MSVTITRGSYCKPVSSLEEALRRLGIAASLNQDIEHNAILINGAPEIMLHALDADEDLVHVPLVARSWPTAAQAVSETCSELLAPASHRLVGDDDTAFRQDQLDIAQTEAENVVQPDGVADDLGWEPMAVTLILILFLNQPPAASLFCYRSHPGGK